MVSDIDIYGEYLLTVLDMDKMVSIKGLVIRTTPVIPDMKTGKHPSDKYFDSPR